MKVRIAFSVVSRLEEPIILVDEVLAVGDRAFREKCYARIEELLAAGRTLFFVSHNERDLRRFCTRGLYLDKGALVLDAPIDQVLARYSEDYAPKAQPAAE
jgi:ABC-2 type transport system ATP-binding protein